MGLTEEQREALGVAVNEATLLGCEVNADQCVAAVTLEVLTLPEKGDPPADPRVQILFLPVGRVAASLRMGGWDDATAEIQPFRIEELLATVQSFGGLPIYGWQFFDRHDEEMKMWGNRLSLDWRSSRDEGRRHSISLFQEGDNRHLDLCLWFDRLEIRTPDGSQVNFEEFCAGGKRWWDAMYSGDPRTKGPGILPLEGTDV